MLVPGLCSVTLRALPAADVAAVAADAGLTAVEWGGDVHAPPGDLATADRVRAATERSGLVVASYGSYFRAGVTDPAEIPPIVATARELGAPRIRVWAGDRASAGATEAQRSAVADGARRMVEQAGEAGIGVAFEFHGNTLTDDPRATLALLARVDGAGTYWQPPNGRPDDEVLAGLDEVAPAVAAVHVFSWWPQTQRQRLSARDRLWRSAVTRLRHTGRDLDFLLEFVPDDDPALIRSEATTLRTWLDGSATDD